MICRKYKKNNNSVRFIDIKKDIKEITKKPFIKSYNQDLANSPDYNLMLDVDTENSILIKMERNYRLNDFTKSYFGIQTYDRNIFVSSKKDNENLRPIIDGTNIKQYAITQRY